MMTNDRRPIIFITTPLEAEHVAALRAVASDRAEVICEPDLWPPTRYVADHNGDPAFVRSAEAEARWRHHLSHAEILFDFPSPSPDGQGVKALVPNVRWVQTTSSGVGQRVKALGFQDTDLLVTNARGVHAGPLSEFVFMALLGYVKGFDHLRSEQRAHHWQLSCGDELAGKTLAVVGAGQIGARVAAVGRAFAMRVVGSARNASDGRASELGLDALYPRDRLHEMLAEADAVVLSTPHTPETENLIDAAAIAAMKDGVVLVNIARGAVIDEAAMIAALRSGKIAFAALDVFGIEPLPADSPLWDMPNVLVSPHSASTVYRENARITEIFCHNLRCYLDGRPQDMRNVLDKQRLY